jgi:hypothetical protein
LESSTAPVYRMPAALRSASMRDMRAASTFTVALVLETWTAGDSP